VTTLLPLFKEHFLATPEVTSSTWEWLIVSDVLLPKAQLCHLLWFILLVEEQRTISTNGI
jgi:hypothetical protein